MVRGVEIVLVDYDPLWAEEFKRVQYELKSALPPWVGPIQHVGSTSVTDLCAKPIVDVLVGVPRLKRTLELVPLLEALGFTFRPDDDLPDRSYFPRTVGGLRCHHVSIAEPTSRHYRNTLLFRDALRSDPGLAQRYGQLKRHLAARVGTDRLSYLNGKTDFVMGVLQATGGEIGDDYPIRDLGRGAE
ncbi:MAG: GrpB family protein [Longimicrobiales bacterium]